MTVVVGLKFQEGIVLAADREESDDYLRDQVQKINVFASPTKSSLESLESIPCAAQSAN
jgi:hypothetical protein